MKSIRFNHVRMYVAAFFVAYVAVCAVGVRGAEYSVDVKRMDAALKELDEHLENRDKYLSDRRQAIAALHGNRNLSPMGKYEAIANAYVKFDNDSAVSYFTRALDVAPTSRDRWRITAERAAVLPQAGFIQQAIDSFNTIPVDSLDDEDLISYYDHGRQMYSLITAFYSHYPDEAMKYSKKVVESHEGLLRALSGEKDSPRYRLNYGEYMLRTGEKVKAETLLREVFDAEPTGSPYRTRAAHILSHLANHRGDTNSELFYLVSAVNNDLLIGLRELPSLGMLAELCYDNGDYGHAYKYIKVLIANAVDSKSIVRMQEASKLLPKISEAHDKEVHSLSIKLYVTVGVLAVALITLVVMTVYRYRRVRRMRAMQDRLMEANRIKEVYIAQFLSMCSIYMDKLVQFNKTVSRKLSAGKADEVLRMTKSGKYIDEQNVEFYETFDNAFLHIYPTFVADVNSLLRPDEQIELKEGEKMNTDLRILAFMRMGIDDSSKIARILNYSLNTIYTYRNKMKSKARNRETFEDDVRKISSI